MGISQINWAPGVSSIRHLQWINFGKNLNLKENFLILLLKKGISRGYIFINQFPYENDILK